MTTSNELIEFQYRVMTAKPNMCLFGNLDCKKTAIKAHSLQNSTIFELLSSDGHVITIGISRDENHKPISKWKRIGRNLASTFTGLCSTHDNSIFEKIDKNPINIQDKEHLFLLAYRALYKELHANLAAGIQSQMSYLKLVDAGLYPKGEPSPPGLFATAQLANAYRTQLYKDTFDTVYYEKTWKTISHEVYELHDQTPIIGCSQLFSVDYVRFRDSVLRIILNILPITPNSSVAIFSFTEEESTLARDYINSRIFGDGPLLKYQISKIVIENTSNFFINPATFSKWSKKRKMKSSTTLQILYLNSK
ncbi:MAG: hypothetical protein IPL46_29575 [Saprospiraceae bacterium]|nr:hypothetical protein [Saprospiraceae bacterium]